MRVRVYLLFFVSSLAQATDSCPSLYEKTYGLTERQEEFLKHKDGNFFDLPRPLEGGAHELNMRSVIEPLRREPLPKSTKRAVELLETEVRALHRSLTHDPKLDPLRCRKKVTVRGDGMCWALAIAAHLKTLGTGLHNKSIRKVWAIGPIDIDGRHWRYHATTIVRVKGKGWYAIDPVFARPMSVEDWYGSMQALDVSGNLRIFSTPAKRFGPSSKQKYNPTEFSRDLYDGFFRDLVTRVRSEVGTQGSAKAPAVVTEFDAALWAKAAAGMGLGAGAMYGLYELSGK